VLQLAGNRHSSQSFDRSAATEIMVLEYVLNLVLVLQLCTLE
jgi:hypothetical protein